MSLRVAMKPGAEGLAPVLTALLLDEPLPEGCRVVSERGRSIVVLAPLSTPGDGRRAYVKCDRPAWPRKLQGSFRKTRCEREFLGLQRLLEVSEQVVEVLGWGERRAGFLGGRSALATVAVEGALDLRDFGRRLEAGQIHESDRARLVASLPAHLRDLARIHEAGLRLYDGYDKNILYIPEATGAAAFRRLDLPHLADHGRPLTRRQALRDLATLDKGLRRFLTPEERESLLATYLAERPELGERDSLQREIDAAVAALHKRTGWRGLIHRTRLRLRRKIGQASPPPTTPLVETLPAALARDDNPRDESLQAATDEGS